MRGYARSVYPRMYLKKVYLRARGEMDITTVFGTVFGGSNPSGRIWLENSKFSFPPRSIGAAKLYGFL